MRHVEQQLHLRLGLVQVVDLIDLRSNHIRLVGLDFSQFSRRIRPNVNDRIWECNTCYRCLHNITLKTGRRRSGRKINSIVPFDLG
jgi:hypothetical protein